MNLNLGGSSSRESGETTGSASYYTTSYDESRDSGIEIDLGTDESSDEEDGSTTTDGEGSLTTADGDDERNSLANPSANTKEDESSPERSATK